VARRLVEASALNRRTAAFFAAVAATAWIAWAFAADGGRAWREEGAVLLWSAAGATALAAVFGLLAARVADRRSLRLNALLWTLAFFVPRAARRARMVVRDARDLKDPFTSTR
jgi:hypothetical protein